MELRWYQKESALAVEESIFSSDTSHPVIALPTGSGKSVVLCSIIDKILSNDPSSNILVLSHVKEILEQDHEKLVDYFDGFDIALYSSGLKTKAIGKVTVAGIQSAHHNIELFKKFKYVIIDEAHLIPFKGSGMYRSFLNGIKSRNIGLTATPYRYGGELIYGHIDITKPKSPMFNQLVYDATRGDKFNRIIDDGYLSKLLVPNTKFRMNTDGIKKVGSDFSQKELIERFDNMDTAKKAIDETISLGDDYKKWLGFAIDINHCDNIARYMNALGVETVSIHSKNKNRDEDFYKFKSGKVRAAVSVESMTTGIDIPDIDLIFGLRPTNSPVIHVQLVGRGMRTADGKDHCLVCDYAGNTARLGPINGIKTKQMKNVLKKKTGSPAKRVCPLCGHAQHPRKTECENCDFIYPVREKIKAKASDVDVVAGRKDNSGKAKTWFDVDSVEYSILFPKNKTQPKFKVTYRCGLRSFYEYIDYDGKGYPKYLAINWVKQRAPIDAGLPANVNGLYKGKDYLKKPRRILINLSSEHYNVIDSILE